MPRVNADACTSIIDFSGCHLSSEKEDVALSIEDYLHAGDMAEVAREDLMDPYFIHGYANATVHVVKLILGKFLLSYKKLASSFSSSKDPLMTAVTQSIEQLLIALDLDDESINTCVVKDLLSPKDFDCFITEYFTRAESQARGIFQVSLHQQLFKRCIAAFCHAFSDNAEILEQHSKDEEKVELCAQVAAHFSGELAKEQLPMEVQGQLEQFLLPFNFSKPDSLDFDLLVSGQCSLIACYQQYDQVLQENPADLCVSGQTDRVMALPCLNAKGQDRVQSMSKILQSTVDAKKIIMDGLLGLNKLVDGQEMDSFSTMMKRLLSSEQLIFNRSDSALVNNDGLITWHPDERFVSVPIMAAASANDDEDIERLSNSSYEEFIASRGRSLDKDCRLAKIINDGATDNQAKLQQIKLAADYGDPEANFFIAQVIQFELLKQYNTDGKVAVDQVSLEDSEFRCQLISSHHRYLARAKEIFLDKINKSLAQLSSDAQKVFDNRVCEIFGGPHYTDVLMYILEAGINLPLFTTAGHDVSIRALYARYVDCVQSKGADAYVLLYDYLCLKIKNKLPLLDGFITDGGGEVIEYLADSPKYVEKKVDSFISKLSMPIKVESGFMASEKSIIERFNAHLKKPAAGQQRSRELNYLNLTIEKVFNQDEQLLDYFGSADELVVLLTQCTTEELSFDFTKRAILTAAIQEKLSETLDPILESSEELATVENFHARTQLSFIKKEIDKISPEVKKDTVQYYSFDQYEKVVAIDFRQIANIFDISDNEGLAREAELLSQPYADMLRKASHGDKRTTQGMPAAHRGSFKRHLVEQQLQLSAQDSEVVQATASAQHRKAKPGIGCCHFDVRFSIADRLKVLDHINYAVLSVLSKGMAESDYGFLLDSLDVGSVAVASSVDIESLEHHAGGAAAAVDNVYDMADNVSATGSGYSYIGSDDALSRASTYVVDSSAFDRGVICHPVISVQAPADLVVAAGAILGDDIRFEEHYWLELERGMLNALPRRPAAIKIEALKRLELVESNFGVLGEKVDAIAAGDRSYLNEAERIIFYFKVQQDFKSLELLLHEHDVTAMQSTLQRVLASSVMQEPNFAVFLASAPVLTDSVDVLLLSLRARFESFCYSINERSCRSADALTYRDAFLVEYKKLDESSLVSQMSYAIDAVFDAQFGLYDESFKTHDNIACGGKLPISYWDKVGKVANLAPAALVDDGVYASYEETMGGAAEVGSMPGAAGHSASLFPVVACDEQGGAQAGSGVPGSEC